MGLWSWIIEPLQLRAPDRAEFSTTVIDRDAIDPALFGLTTYEDSIAPAPRVSRSEAIQVPAVKRSRDLICATLGGLPMVLHDKDRREVEGPGSGLLAQPEHDVPRSVTMTRTLEDMLFEGIAWWRVTKRAFTGYPVEVVKLDPRSVNVTKDHRVYVRGDGNVQGSAVEWVPDRDLIRFDSPNDPLLVAGARAIRTLLRLDRAASNYADSPLPLEFFTPGEGADPADDDEILAMLTAWKAARQARSTGYIPASLKHNQIMPMTAEQLQLADSRQHAVLEIARMAGIDPEDLGVSTTSRTYQNGETRRRDLLDFTLAAYQVAIQDRLSMGDVTPRGQFVRMKLDAFLRSDTKTRFEAYAIGEPLGAITREEIRMAEDRPPLPKEAQAAPDVRPLAPVRKLAAAGADLLTFSDPADGIVFESETDGSFSVDVERRLITGMAVPFGKVGKSRGRRWRFTPGSLQFTDLSRIKLLNDHDHSQAVGRCVKTWATEAGQFAIFKVAHGTAGDRALADAEQKVRDGLSVGVDFTDPNMDLIDDPEEPGVLLVLKAQWKETSLCAIPSFDDARVTSVAASHSERDLTMSDPTPAAVPVATPGAAPAAPAPAAPVGFTADDLRAAFSAALTEFAGSGPEIIRAGGSPVAQVTEQPLYRFDGAPGQQCFSRDLIAGLSGRDSAAEQRLTEWMSSAEFNVTVANVSTLNPNIQRPDMYVDQMEFAYPFWDATKKGTLTENTPFVVPKFGTSSSLVADHTEGVEPAGAGALTTGSQTITPVPLSGKAVVNREVWDQGGNPQLDTILWRQIVRAYYEGLEAYVVAQLAANVASITDLTITTAAADAALEASITSQLATLQYVRGGNQFRDFIVQVDLYKALIAAKDTTGRKLFPILGPQNSTGTTDPFFADVMVGGLRARPGWALAPTGVVSADSWLFNREYVHTWASAPRKLTMDAIKVATVEVGVWGYKAFAITDFNGIRQVTYDPV